MPYFGPIPSRKLFIVATSSLQRSFIIHRKSFIYDVSIHKLSTVIIVRVLANEFNFLTKSIAWGRKKTRFPSENSKQKHTERHKQMSSCITIDLNFFQLIVINYGHWWRQFETRQRQEIAHSLRYGSGYCCNLYIWSIYTGGARGGQGRGGGRICVCLCESVNINWKFDRDRTVSRETCSTSRSCQIKSSWQMEMSQFRKK